MKKILCILFGLCIMFGISTSVLAKASQAKVQAVQLVNVNKADVKTLMSIKGIGKTIANRIVSFRDSNGRFKKIGDLVKVKGISQATLDRLLKNNPNKIRA